MIPLRNVKRFAHKALRQPGYALKVLGKRICASMAYARSDGSSCRPESITLYLTGECNLRCRMCGQWGDRGVYREDAQTSTRVEGRRTKDEGKGPQYMSMALVTKVLDGVRPWRPNITLFGGEPMLHPDCVKIIRAIKERGMHCLMITNGSLIEWHAAELAESGLDELNVSIDGRGQVHDGIRQSSGLYARVISGLSGVRSARRGKRKPFINIQCTISRFNQHALHEMAAVAREAGADSLTLHHLIFIDETVRSPHTGRDNGLGRMREHWEGFLGSAGIDVPLVWREIRSLRRAIRQARFDVYPNFTYSQMKEYYALRPPSRRRGCKSPWVCAYVFPDGELRPCLNFTYSFGNAADDPIEKLWNSRAAQAYRRRLKQEKSFPACKRCTELFRY